MLLNQIKDNILASAHKLGISKFDLYGVLRQEASASAKEGDPFDLSYGSKTSLTIRVWNKNDKIGIINTSNITEQGLVSAFEMALVSAQYNENQYDFPLEGQAHSSVLHLSKQKIFNDVVEKQFVPLSELSGAAVSCEKFLLDSLDCIKSVPYNKVKQAFSHRFYINSQELFLNQSQNSFICYFYPLAVQEHKVPRQAGVLSFSNNFEDLNPLKCAQESLDKLKSYLDYQEVKNGIYDVIFGPEAFLALLGAFGNFFNAQNIYDQKSLTKRQDLGTQFASSNINLYDDALNSQNLFKTFFDEEGNTTKPLQVIKNGLLENFMHSSFTAEKFNVKPTGHTSLGAKLTLSHHFLVIDPSDQGISDFDFKKTYVYVEQVKSLHAGINALQGSFSLPFDGFLFSDGERKSIESAVVAGDFLTLLKNIAFVGAKQCKYPSGVCPEIGVRGLSITSGLKN